MPTPSRTLVHAGGVTFGGPDRPIIAGPCAVESFAQYRETALFLKDLGVRLLRGGAFKPRTSPQSFQGLGTEGLDIIARVCAETGQAPVIEAIDTEVLPDVAAVASVIQVGSRNMHNFSLLKKVGRYGKPVLLKRGFMATISEFLQAAEYILQDTDQVILCERGIRTFEPMTRATLDLAAVPLAHALSAFPIIVDPSHAAGRWDLVAPLARMAFAGDADGLLVEIHPDPPSAQCDREQALPFSEFRALARALAGIPRPEAG